MGTTGKTAAADGLKPFQVWGIRLDSGNDAMQQLFEYGTLQEAERCVDFLDSEPGFWRLEIRQHGATQQ